MDYEKIIVRSVTFSDLGREDIAKESLEQYKNEYIDSIYKDEYENLVLKSSYPSISLKLVGEEADGEIVEFFL